MSVVLNELKFYGSANMPDVDGTTTGGAVSFSVKIDFTDPSAAGTMDVISSSGSDTACTLTTTGRDSTGVIVSEAKTTNGVTAVTGSQSFERLLKVVASGTTAVGDLAVISHTKVITNSTAQAGSANKTGTTPAVMKLKSGDKASVAVGQIIHTQGGTGPNQLREIVSVDSSLGTDVVAVNRDWGTVPDATTTYDVHQGFLLDILPSQITQVRRPFYNAASDIPGGSTRIYYEKIFAVNVNTTTALTLASILKQADPNGMTLDFALTTVLNDTGTVANRQTAPASGVGSYSSGLAPQTIAVPSPQNLPSGAAPNAAGAQGVWLRGTLTAGLAPQKTSETMRVTGQTT